MGEAGLFHPERIGDMNEGWIKLYRKLKDNPVIFDDKASRVLLWLFLSVDQKNGSLTFGRYSLAREIRMNDNTLYKVLKRLDKKYQIVTTSSNKTHTTITFLNWAKYQPSTKTVTTSSNNKVTTEEQQSNTKQEYKNKELKNNNILATDVAGGLELKSLNFFLGRFEKLNPEYEKFFSNKTERKSMAEMVNKYGFEKMENLLSQLPEIVIKPYAPSISSPSELQKKMGLLLQFLAKQKDPVSKSAIYSDSAIYLEEKT